MKRIFIIASLLFSANLSFSQLVVDNTTMTVEQYLQNVLLGGGVSISNVTLNGGPANVSNEQVGSFTDAASSSGFPAGVILGSGDVQMASQANTGGGSNLGGTGAQGSDPDLSAITAPNDVFDEVIIEFDFVPSGDELNFNYVFASEEYEEYSCAGYTDAFGFFLTGPNPAGTNYASTNIALVPDPANPGSYTTTPVQINTVNQGAAGVNGTLSNCTSLDPNFASYNVFYQTNGGTDYEYDGRTTVLTAFANVICGETYHIKLAIGDAGDGSFDSGVFLEANSFNSSGISISANVNAIHEGCPGAYYVITRPDTNVFAQVPLVIQGTATNGTDYDFIDNPHTFATGELTDTIWLIPNSLDGDTVSIDTVEIYIDDSSACGGPIIEILQAEPLRVFINDGDTICTETPFNESWTFNSAVTGGVPGAIYYQWLSNNGYDFMGTQNDSSVTVSPQEAVTEFRLQVFDVCGSSAETDVSIVWVQCPLTAPNVFTPNGDAANQYFEIENMHEYPNSTLEVFNRWGTKVYESENYNNDWDGGNLSDGIYFWIVYPSAGVPEFGNGKSKEPFSGTVTIIR